MNLLYYINFNEILTAKIKKIMWREIGKKREKIISKEGYMYIYIYSQNG